MKITHGRYTCRPWSHDRVGRLEITQRETRADEEFVSDIYAIISDGDTPKAGL